MLIGQLTISSAILGLMGNSFYFNNNPIVEFLTDVLFGLSFDLNVTFSLNRVRDFKKKYLFHPFNFNRQFVNKTNITFKKEIDNYICHFE